MNQRKGNVAYNFSNHDINRLLGKGHIMTYGELSKYDDIDDVFGNNDFVVLLIQVRKNYGHWVAILKYPENKTIELFDSYKGTIDNELSYVSATQKKLLGETRPYLSELIKESGWKQVVSPYRFQELKDGINTCGRHVV